MSKELGKSSPSPQKRERVSLADLPSNFCVGPWVQQVAMPTGRVGYCCVAIDGGLLTRPDGERYVIPENSMSDVWNSDATRLMRRKMLSGENIPDCSNCYFQESIGKTSSRQMLNQEWYASAPEEVSSRIADSIAHDGFVGEGPLYLDLRLGNLCNLKCRSCNAFNSSRLMNEAIEMTTADAEYRKLYFGEGHWPLKPIRPWFESEEFWTSVEEQLPRLRKVYLTGGEPMLIQRNLWFLKKCVETGHSKHIMLMFNTNCTRLPESVLELLPRFELSLVNCSIDAIGAENDYIRDGSEWEVLDRNLRRLVTLQPNVQVGFTPVVQILNVFCLVELLRYIEELNPTAAREINVDFLYANEPRHLDIRILPDGVRDTAATRLEKFRAQSKFFARGVYAKNSLDSCISALRSERLPYGDDFLRHFLSLTHHLDVKRGRSFKQTFPELASRLDC